MKIFEYVASSVVGWLISKIGVKKEKEKELAKPTPVKPTPKVEQEIPDNFKLGPDGSEGFLFKLSEEGFWKGRPVLLLPAKFSVKEVWLEGRNQKIFGTPAGIGNGERQHWRWELASNLEKKIGEKPFLKISFEDNTSFEFKLRKGFNHRYD
jgi:hypothetical protein